MQCRLDKFLSQRPQFRYPTTALEINILISFPNASFSHVLDI